MWSGVLPAALLFLLRVKLISAVFLSVPHEITLGQSFTFNWTRGSADPDTVVLWPVSNNGSDTLVVHHTDYHLNMSSQSSGRAKWLFDSENPTLQPGSYLIYAIPDNNDPIFAPPSSDTVTDSMMGLSNQFIVNGSPATLTTTTSTTSIVPSSSETSILSTSFSTPTPSQSPLSSTSKPQVSPMMIAIISASIVALLLFAPGIYLLLRQRQRRRAANSLSAEDGRTDPYSKLEGEATTSPPAKPDAAIREESARVEKHSRVPSALERTWWDDAP